jgi:hypothetical protein
MIRRTAAFPDAVLIDRLRIAQLIRVQVYARFRPVRVLPQGRLWLIWLRLNRLRLNRLRFNRLRLNGLRRGARTRLLASGRSRIAQ